VTPIIRTGTGRDQTSSPRRAPWQPHIHLGLSGPTGRAGRDVTWPSDATAARGSVRGGRWAESRTAARSSSGALSIPSVRLFAAGHMRSPGGMVRMALPGSPLDHCGGRRGRQRSQAVRPETLHSDSNPGRASRAGPSAARLADGHVRREGVDLDGRVIGIPTTLAALDSDLGDTAPPAIGFAIASNQVRTVARRIGVEKAFGPCLPTPCSTRAGCRASAHRGHHPYCSEG
jgi:hypothetical protein